MLLGLSILATSDVCKKVTPALTFGRGEFGGTVESLGGQGWWQEDDCRRAWAKSLAHSCQAGFDPRDATALHGQQPSTRLLLRAAASLLLLGLPCCPTSGDDACWVSWLFVCQQGLCLCHSFVLAQNALHLLHLSLACRFGSPPTTPPLTETALASCWQS